MRFFLPEAAGFIFDFPSTTFLEALSTDKPIFICLNPRLTHLDPGVESIIARRVVLCRGIHDLEDQLRRYFGGQSLPVNFKEISVRQHFATHLDDGLSLDRAVQALESVCGGHQ